MGIQSGDNNNFPQGQCTWWADERYHELTGFYVPWNHTGQANAYQWLAQAQAFGWNTASTPPKGIPSIICLQGSAGQGVESSLGHVAIVEKINSDGSLVTSDMNWSVGTILQTVNGYPVRQVTFKTGSGVSFIWAGGGQLSNISINSGNNDTNSGGGAGGTTTYVPLLEQVHEILVNVPGFDGMALAIHKAEEFQGWVNLVDPSVQAFGVNFDVVGWIRSLGATCTDNFTPFLIRSMLISLGLFILFLLVLKVTLEVGDKALPIIRAVAA